MITASFFDSFIDSLTEDFLSIILQIFSWIKSFFVLVLDLFLGLFSDSSFIGRYVVDFFDDLVSCIPCSDHKYIPSVHTCSAHIAKHTQTAVRISASHDKYKQKQSIQNVKASWHRVHIPPVPKQYQHCHNNGIQNTC